MSARAPLCILILAALATPAGAATNPGPPVRELWAPNRAVDTAAIAGGRAFVAGDFTRVGPYTGASALLDRETGEARPDWPRVRGIVAAVAEDGAGGWFIGGHFDQVGGVPRDHLAHISADGTVDPAFAPKIAGGTGYLPVAALARVQGTLYFGGDFATVDGIPRGSGAAVQTADGALTPFDAAIVNPFMGGVRALVARRTGPNVNVVVAGAFSGAGGQPRVNVASFTNGALDPFAPQVPGIVHAVEYDGLTGVYVGGEFATVNGQPRAGAARVSGVDGQTTSAFTADLAGDNGSLPGPLVADFVRVPGALYLAGDFETVNGTARPHLARVDPATGAVADWAPAVEAPPGGRALAALAVDTAAGTVFAGGPISGVRAYDATSGARSEWDPVPEESVYAVALDGDGVLAGGSFTVAGGVPRDGFAEIDLATGRPTALDVSVNGRIADMAVADGRLYLAGTFTGAAGPGGGLRPDVAALDPATGSWTGFAVAEQVPGWLDVEVSGTRVWLAGGSRLVAYDDLGGLPAAVPVTIRTDAAVGGGSIQAIALTEDAVYAGGAFTGIRVNNQTIPAPRASLAAFDATDGELLPWDPGADDDVQGLLTVPGAVFARGEFGTAGGAARDGLAGLDPASGAATALTPPGTPVRAFAPFGDSLIVGGAGLASLDAATGAATPLAPGLGPLDFLNEIVTSTERGVLVAGSFSFGGGANVALLPLVPPRPAVTAEARDGAADVSVDLPGDGGAPVTEITVTASPGGATATGAGSPINVPGLANGTAYTFTARATNAQGTSPESEPSAPVTPVAAPVPTATATAVATATATPVPRVDARVTARGRVRRGRTRVRRLRVTRVPAGAKVQLRCAPRRRCSLKRARALKVSRTGAAGARRLVLRRGATLEVRVTLPGAIGQAVRYRAVRKRFPRPERLCLPQGVKTPQTC